MSSELWQAYSDNGEPDRSRGISIEQGRQGGLHGAAHVWIWRRGAHGVEVLFQRRSHNVPTWPGFLDVSAAGHIDFGESPLEAAIRETKEELGVVLYPSDLKLAFVYKMSNMCFPDVDIVENELQWVYLVSHEGAGLDLDLDRVEVDGVKWIEASIIRTFQNSDSRLGQTVVPHGNDYFNLLARSLQQGAA